MTSSAGQFGADGWLSGAKRAPSPNADVRPSGVVVDLIVVHAISLPPARYGTGDPERLFTNTLDFDAHPFFDGLRDLHVSAHFLIARDGVMTQFVSTERRAWHAGVSAFAGRTRCNDFSVGIELEGCDADIFTAAQYARLGSLIGAIQVRYPSVTPARVVGHSDIAPGRKTDPGPYFDWGRLRALLGV
jgi:N-acetyl-anhydromuramoyl-L-alanine amidase